MAEHNEKGKAGEALACSYLTKRGYTIVETNWRFAKAEIDIIAKKSNNLAIVEVKTRASADFGEPERWVTLKKQKLIIKATSAYVLEHNCQENIRFDIIAILFDRKPPEIRHIEGAYYPLMQRH